MKKIIAFILTLAVILSCAVTVFGAEETSQVLFDVNFENSSAEGYEPELFQINASDVSHVDLNDGVHNNVLQFKNGKSWYSPKWDLNAKLKAFAQKNSGQSIEISVSVDIFSHGKNGVAGMLFRGNTYYKVLKDTTNIGLDKWVKFEGALTASAEEIIGLADKGEFLLMFENLTENNTFYLDNLKVTVKVLPEIKGAKLTLGGQAYAIAGTSDGSPFDALDFGSDTAKTLKFTVYNTSSTDIQAVYVASGWNTYFTEGGTRMDGTISQKKIPSGMKAEITLKIPKNAKANDGNDKSYKDMALRIDFAKTTVNGESVIVSCENKNVTASTAKSKPFKGITKIEGVTELPELSEVGKYNFTTGVKQADGSIVYGNGYIPVTDENLIFSGRWTEKDGKKTLGFEGYVEIAFTGTSLKVLNVESWNVYASVDGNEPVKLASDTVASGLEKGEHTVRIYAAAQQAFPAIGGFAIDAGEKTLKVTKGKVIEFIGDSITEGYVAPDDKEKWGANSYMNSYAYLTGEKLNRKYGMQYNTIAFGGIGLCSYDSKETPTQDYMTMDERYKKAREFKVGDTSSTTVENWNMSLYVPDYIVINLGTNDCGRGEANFKAQYKNFLAQLRSYYPKARIVAVVPCYFHQMNLTGFVSALKSAVDETGDGNIYVLDTADWGVLGGEDNLHPSPASHRVMSDKLFAYLDNLMNPATPAPDSEPTPSPKEQTPMPSATSTPEPNNKPVFSGEGNFEGGICVLAVMLALGVIVWLNRHRLASYIKK